MLLGRFKNAGEQLMNRVPTPTTQGMGKRYRPGGNTKAGPKDTDVHQHAQTAAMRRKTATRGNACEPRLRANLATVAHFDGRSDRRGRVWLRVKGYYYSSYEHSGMACPGRESSSGLMQIRPSSATDPCAPLAERSGSKAGKLDTSCFGLPAFESGG